MRTIHVPGDKSISHRALMLAPLASGISRIRDLSTGADVRATARAMTRLGADAAFGPGDAALEIAGPVPLRAPTAPIDCANSGTTARLLSGLIAGVPITARLDGDASLRRRPMGRVLDPLRAAGGRIRNLGEADRLPVEISGGRLSPIRHVSPVASAQIKSALLLAGVAAGVEVEVKEPGLSRDHTERMLEGMGADVTSEPLDGGRRVVFRPSQAELRPLELVIPGDVSSAAFFLGLAALGGVGSGLRVEGVGLNPGRTGFLLALDAMGARVETHVTGDAMGEPVGSISVQAMDLHGVELPPEWLPTLLDEIPALACLAARAAGRTVIRGAAELRVKESDRLTVLQRNLTGLGVRVDELPDGLIIEGTAGPLEGAIETHGDHRIAMAFGMLGAAPGVRLRLDEPTCTDVSYPGFWEVLARIGGDGPTNGSER